MSVPELAEQLGHAPAMTIGTYTHVIRELKGEPIGVRPRSKSNRPAGSCRDVSGRTGSVAAEGA